MLNLLGFNTVVNRWINLANDRDDLLNPVVVENIKSGVVAWYGEFNPYTHFVVTDICAEDLLCYEVEF